MSMEQWRNLVLRDAIKPNLRMLQALGYWPPEDGSASARKRYLIFGYLFVGFTYVLYMTSEVINIFLSRHDLEEITEASFLFLTHLAQTVKLYHFSTKNLRVKQLADSLQSERFKPRNARQYRMLRRSIWESHWTYYIFMIMAFATCILWAVFPLVEKSEDGNVGLPLKAYYPFRTDRMPVLAIIFVYQIFATIVNASTNISMDTVLSSFMSVVGGELDTLNDTLVHIKEFAVERLEARGEHQLDGADERERFGPALQLEMDAVLVECVHQHYQILDCTIEIGELFNYSVLGQFAVSAIIICITMFELTLVKLFSLQFVSMVLYQGCMLMEIFLYCWFGNEIILKSSDIAYSAYCSDWYRCAQPFKSNILMIMTRAQVPIRLYAGNLFTLSVITFAAILRTSWSYFAVLRRVHTED